ncbi:hypothetical protein E3U55_03535 [Filobacillus milosensis]|uniref:Uncharacterized protein n=1 Tax=Filobacillus milosensis TaxID=94137 RepID=A0A4Y8ISY1_9BACI|nr:hypothetical protein [Filobacillus milosensis]TFB23897.1 hypothetical protein E3U55_03535 [Filobacillus milosensis]
MKNNMFALFVSLFVLVGFPIVFLFISLFTGQWSYIVWSIPPSLLAGLTGLMITLNQIKQKKNHLKKIFIPIT